MLRAWEIRAEASSVSSPRRWFAVACCGAAICCWAGTAHRTSAPAIELHLPGYYDEEIFSPPLAGPHHIDVGPSGIIAITDSVGEDVIQLHEDGSLSTYASPSPNRLMGLAFSPSGDLYVADWNRILWKVTPGKVVSQVATGVYNYGLDVAPTGDVFAVTCGETNIQRVTPSGQVTVYAAGFTNTQDVAVCPVAVPGVFAQGDVVVFDIGAGQVFKVDSIGLITLLADAPTTDASYVDFAPDGTLYFSCYLGLYEYSPATGDFVLLAWTTEGHTACTKDFSFDASGRPVVVDVTFNHVLRFDMDTETIEALWVGVSGSTAFDVAPNGAGIHMGVTHPLATGTGRVVRIEPDGSTTDVVTGLLSSVDALAFDGGSTMYISAMQPSAGGYHSTIYSATLAGAKAVLTTLPYVCHSLAVDPDTGYLWGTGYQDVWYHDGVDTHTVRFVDVIGGFSCTGDESITFTPDGSLFLHCNRTDNNGVPVSRGVYRVGNVSDPYTSSTTFTLIADTSTVGICCVMGRMGGARDGNIYWAGLGDRHTPGNVSDMHMLRISPGGGVTLFATDLPIDPTAVVGCPDSDDIYFCSGTGVYRIFSESAAVFRVESWRGNVRADGTFYSSSFATGHGDVAEWVEVSESVEPGDVLELDPSASTTYRLSQTACSTLVAGVISTEPGVVLGSPPTTHHSPLTTYS